MTIDVYRGRKTTMQLLSLQYFSGVVWLPTELQVSQYVVSAELSIIFDFSVIVFSWGSSWWISIGVGRFRIFVGGTGGAGFRILGGPRFRILGGQIPKQAHDVVTTSMRRNDVASTSSRRHVPTRFLINQYQIIKFLILKSDIENSRIELRGIVLPVSSNQIKVTLNSIIILPFNFVHLWFFPVSHRNWRKRWVDYWVGQRVCCPPLSNYWGGLLSPTLSPHSPYAYDKEIFTEQLIKCFDPLHKLWTRVWIE